MHTDELAQRPSALVTDSTTMTATQGRRSQSSGSGACPPVVKDVAPQTGLAALEKASQSVGRFPSLLLASVRELIGREELIARRVVENPVEGPADRAVERLTAGPVLAILLDPVLGNLTGQRRDARLRQIMRETSPAPRRVVQALQVMAAMAVVVGVGAIMIFGRGISPMFILPLLSIPAMLWGARPSPSSRDDLSVRYPRINLSEARQVAAIVRRRPNPVDAGSGLTPAAVPCASRKPTAGDVRQAVDDLLAEWGKYRLDIEAWYVTKPLLHDTTGTVATTVAYERAMDALIAAADDLPDDASQARIDEAVQLADAAWAAWHAADEYATGAGLGDRSPSERAALQRLGRLVERLTRSAASDPELPMIKRSIQDCLDRVSTVSVSWGDIATLPAIEAAVLVPQIPAGDQSN